MFGDGPSRGGVRGGQDQFTWDSVKQDKHRENYLGHSVKAPVGRWQKNKNLNWYAEKEEKQKLLDDEIKRIKEAEQEALAEALGFKVVRKKSGGISKEEIQQAVKHSQDAAYEADPNALGGGYGLNDDDKEAEIIEGVGYGRRGMLSQSTATEGQKGDYILGEVVNSGGNKDSIHSESTSSKHFDTQIATDLNQIRSKKEKKERKKKKEKKEKDRKRKRKESPRREKKRKRSHSREDKRKPKHL